MRLLWFGVRQTCGATSRVHSLNFMFLVEAASSHPRQATTLPPNVATCHPLPSLFAPNRSFHDLHHRAQEMDDTPPTAQAAASDDKNLIADNVRDHLVAVDTFDGQLDYLINAERDFGGLPSKIKQRLAAYRGWITTAGENCHAANHKEIAPWAVGARRMSSHNFKIVLTGPANDDEVEVEAKDESEADYIMGVRCKKCTVVEFRVPCTVLIIGC
jgi:hypothetical protein